MTKSVEENYEKSDAFRAQLRQWLQDLNARSIDAADASSENALQDANTNDADDSGKPPRLPFQFPSDAHERDWLCMKHALVLSLLQIDAAMEAEGQKTTRDLLQQWTSKVARNIS